jgi:hypothetical protein
VGNAAAIDAFSSGFYKHAGQDFHEPGIKPAGSCHHEGIFPHSRDDAFAQRVSPGWHRTAVNTPGQSSHIDIAILSNRFGYSLLHWVFDFHVVLGVRAQLA